MQGVHSAHRQMQELCLSRWVYGSVPQQVGLWVFVGFQRIFLNSIIL